MGYKADRLRIGDGPALGFFGNNHDHQHDREGIGMIGSEALERDVHDVCNIFKELTGADVTPSREASAIVPWIRDFKWTNRDFRMVIEYSLRDPKTKDFLEQPGRMNLRTIFGTHRRDLLLDIHSDLKRAKEILAKKREMDSQAPDIREQEVRLSDGIIFIRKFIKISEGAAHRWKWVNRDDYEKLFGA